MIKYLLLLIGAIIEGPILFMVGGFLLRLGTVALAPLFVAFMAGDLIGDVVWYYLGAKVAAPILARHGRFLSLTPERLERVKGLFARHHGKILFSSKATLGFGTSVGTLVILLTAGVTRVPIFKYLWLNALGEVVLLTIMISLGYLFGQFYHSFETGLAAISSGVLLLLAVAVIWGFSRYLKNRTS